MSQLPIEINGRAYSISCEDGQEAHLRQLADYVETRVQDVVQSAGQVGDARILVMACLLIADELSDLTSEHQKTFESTENRAADIIEALAAQLEAIAARLEET
jgi:cell division protein ZapA